MKFNLFRHCHYHPFKIYHLNALFTRIITKEKSLNTRRGDIVNKRIQRRLWLACKPRIGSKVWGYNSFTPAASQYIPSLKWENIGAREWEETEGEEALKITLLPCNVVFGSPSTAQKKTLSSSSYLHHFLFFPFLVTSWSFTQSQRW